ncbi:MAG: hypothetical protein D6B25_18225 [Desulfobulbaceae bacterium]|nr:MAG: hypothetical protein D6B25_18225 [Desulfobulbaceae bacterium]
MLSTRKISLSAAPFYASLLVIISLASFIGIFWAVNEYQAHQESIENIRKTYDQQYRERLREESEKVIDFLNFARFQALIAAEDEIRDRVQSAYTIASHLHSSYRDEKGSNEIRSMIAEILRPVRWYDGKGYYFAGRTDSGMLDLFADEPFFEGKSGLEALRKQGENPIGSMINIVTDKGAGTFRYTLRKPAFPEQEYSKISFVKYFDPLDWFIGAGIYNNDMERLNQSSALTRIKKMKFGQGGEIFVFRFDGTLISHQNEQLVGRSIRSLQSDEENYGEKIWLASKSSRQGSYIKFTETTGSEAPLQKLCFVNEYNDWGWVIATSMYMSEMEALVADATETYRRIAFKNVSTFIFLFIISVSLLLLVAYYYTVKIKQGFNIFTDFFRRAADSKIKIEEHDLTFREFEELTHLANNMVDDLVQKERVIRLDELRLDTLLRLGTMEDFSLREKYEFTLQRIIQLTRSEEGYLALVNKRQSHISIITQYQSDGTHVHAMRKRDRLCIVDSNSLPGVTVAKQDAVICNDSQITNPCHLYPYQNKKIKRNLDVPIVNEGLIVLVAGVCNKKSDYDTSDVKQMTMLLEGMWLHIIKTRAERKMAQLRTQVIAAREAERSHIGRILHDDLGSHLSGVELLSKALHTSLDSELPQRAHQIETIRGFIVDATEKTRRLARGLYPVHIIEDGLEAAIEELAAEIEKLFGVSCQLFFNSGVENIDNNLSTHIYYIVREAAFNAARHGEPNSITISLRVENQHLNIEVKDDGSGFDISLTRKGMGLQTIEYRASAIGATFSIDAESGTGTVVSVSGDISNR